MAGHQVVENVLIANGQVVSVGRTKNFAHVIQLFNETQLAFIGNELSMLRCPHIRLAGGSGQEIEK